MPLSAPQAAFIEDKFSDSADKYWELFYRQNGNRLYKDRHYFAREFPELVSRPGCAVLECGCGAGNSAYPLVEENPTCRVYACDFSPRAVELVKRHPLYASGRVTAFVADITRPDHLPGSHVPPGTVDFATCVVTVCSRCLCPAAATDALQRRKPARLHPHAVCSVGHPPGSDC